MIIDIDYGDQHHYLEYAQWSMVDGYFMVKLDGYVKGLPFYISAMVKVKIGIAVVKCCGKILRFNHFYHEKFGFWLWMFETMGFFLILTMVVWSFLTT